MTTSAATRPSTYSPDSLAGLLEVDARKWRTPLTGIEQEHLDARLKPTSYARGFYRMEQMAGYEMYRVMNGRLPVQRLQRRVYDRPRPYWKTWMVDDPLHWLGMRQVVMDLPPGKLVVAGLGLGLFAHHIAAERADITEIVVVEIDHDVVDLIVLTLPDSLFEPNAAGRPRLQIVRGDYYEFIAGMSHNREHGLWWPDAVLWDLAVGEQRDTRSDFYRALAATSTELPNVPLFCFGLRAGKRTILG
jgi:hypothetical protein